MAIETFTFNIAKGRGVEFFNRVDSDDPSPSAIVIVPLATGGTQAQGQDLATLAAVEADANFSEQTAGGWARVVLTQAELAAISVDNANNRFPATVPAIAMGSPTAGSDAVGFLVCYDANTGAGADSDIIPITCHARTVTADGNAVQINAGDILRAS